VSNHLAELLKGGNTTVRGVERSDVVQRGQRGRRKGGGIPFSSQGRR